MDRAEADPAVRDEYIAKEVSSRYSCANLSFSVREPNLNHYFTTKL